MNNQTMVIKSKKVKIRRMINISPPLMPMFQIIQEMHKNYTLDRVWLLKVYCDLLCIDILMINN